VAAIRVHGFRIVASRPRNCAEGARDGQGSLQALSVTISSEKSGKSVATTILAAETGERELTAPLQSRTW